MKNKGGPWFRFRPEVFSRVFPDPEPEWRKYAIFGFRPAQRSVFPCFPTPKEDLMDCRGRAQLDSVIASPVVLALILLGVYAVWQ